MATSDLISICVGIVSFVALLISIFSLITQRKYSKKSDLLQSENNSISNEVLRLSKDMNSFLKDKSEIKILNVFAKFIIVQQNCWDRNGTMKSDRNSFDLYIRELKLISNELNLLVEEPCFLELQKVFPDVLRLPIILADFISILDSRKKLEVNTDVFRIMFFSYDLILKSIDKGNKYYNDNWHREVLKVGMYLEKEISRMS